MRFVTIARASPTQLVRGLRDVGAKQLERGLDGVDVPPRPRFDLGRAGTAGERLVEGELVLAVGAPGLERRGNLRDDRRRLLGLLGRHGV